jgi:uncharacterized DUF497 family protein
MRRKGSLQEYYAEYEGFDWDDRKAAVTLKERGIDFLDVARCFFNRGSFFRRQVIHGDEVRWQAFGYMHEPDRLLSVVYTERDGGTVCRLISVRAADDSEREDYHGALQAG